MLADLKGHGPCHAGTSEAQECSTEYLRQLRSGDETGTLKTPRAGHDGEVGLGAQRWHLLGGAPASLRVTPLGIL